jgi:hypothetical protein
MGKLDFVAVDLKMEKDDKYICKYLNIFENSFKRIMNMLLIFILIFVCCCNVVNSQNNCIAMSFYSAVNLYEYDIVKIQNDKLLTPKKILYKDNEVNVVGFLKDYAIIEDRGDTLVTYCYNLKSECDKFNEYACQISLRKVINKISDNNLFILNEKEKAKLLDNVVLHGVVDAKDYISLKKDVLLDLVCVKENIAYVYYCNKIYWTYIKYISCKTADIINENYTESLNSELSNTIQDIKEKKGFVEADNIKISDISSIRAENMKSHLETIVSGDIILIGLNNDDVYFIQKKEFYSTKYTNISHSSIDSLRIIVERIEKEERAAEIKKHRIDAEKIKENQIINSENRKRMLIEKYGMDIANLIIKGHVKIGMSKQMVVESWGNPLKINKTTTKYSTIEQWVYRNGNYLYFKDDELETIQN